MSRFVLLDRTRFDVTNNLTVLGCTLFSDVVPQQTTEVDRRLIDFNHIHGWTVGDHVAAHRGDLEWLNQQVCEIEEREPLRSIAIFTHHSPTTDSRTTDPRHAGSPVSSDSVQTWPTRPVGRARARSFGALGAHTSIVLMCKMESASQQIREATSRPCRKTSMRAEYLLSVRLAVRECSTCRSTNQMSHGRSPKAGKEGTVHQD